MVDKEFNFSEIEKEIENYSPEEKKQKTKKPKEKKDPGERMRAKSMTTVSDRHLYRRAYSESQLLDILGIDFKDGECYHCITGGNVDALSYLKVILRQQDLEYCLFSTWCMAADDVLDIETWLNEGKIKKIDAYVGEIFPNSYPLEYARLIEIVPKFGGRVAVFRNHSKIFAGYGKKFYFGVETSANINTNPRVENGCMTIGKGIFDFYFEYYSGIKSIK